MTKNLLTTVTYSICSSITYQNPLPSLTIPNGRIQTKCLNNMTHKVIGHIFNGTLYNNRCLINTAQLVDWANQFWELYQNQKA